MLRPAATQLISKNDSYYSLVIGVAKRAREIADELVEEKKILEEKPVKSSVEELANGKYRIIEAKEEETIQETETPVLTEIEF
ncbi:MAG: DNA-directed RNA polymerase subunit omega [Oscillospiraceae bacterium]|nr:DNA-directed RNA polymerase subunit omega [Oscillospiraceae bacterium]